MPGQLGAPLGTREASPGRRFQVGLLPKRAGSTPWSDSGQEGSTGTEALGERWVGGRVWAPGCLKLFKKYTLWLLFISGGLHET